MRSLGAKAHAVGDPTKLAARCGVAAQPRQEASDRLAGVDIRAETERGERFAPLERGYGVVFPASLGGQGAAGVEPVFGAAFRAGDVRGPEIGHVRSGLTGALGNRCGLGQSCIRPIGAA